MTITITTLPTDTMRNSRDPVAVNIAPRCQTQWTLCLTADGEVSVSGRDYYGGDGTPLDEHLARTLTWGFGRCGDCNVIDREVLAEALAEGGDLHTLLARVHAGHTVSWDGSNHRGRLTGDASEAAEEIDRMLSGDRFLDNDAPAIWDVGEWLWSNCRSAAAVLSTILDDMPLDATDEQIETKATELLKTAESDGIELSGDIAAAIREIIAITRRDAGDDAE